MRFLLDENVPAKLASVLRERGHDAVMLDALLRAAPDRVVLASAAQNDRVLLTLDKDFGDLVFVTNAPAPPALVLIRPRPVELVARLSSVVEAIERAAAKGSFVVIGHDPVRVRPLPP